MRLSHAPVWTWIDEQEEVRVDRLQNGEPMYVQGRRIGYWECEICGYRCPDDLEMSRDRAHELVCREDKHG